MWHYYKDDKIPYGDWTVTVTDVNRWREMMRSRFPDYIEQGVDSENPLRDRTTQWTQIDELGEVSNYYEMSPLLEFLQAVPNQEASYAQSKK